MEAALGRATEMELAHLHLRTAEGELLSATGVFDPRVEAFISSIREMEHSADGGAEFSTVEQNVTSYRIGLAKRTEWGLLVQPALTVTRSAPNALFPDPLAVARVDLGFVMPLQRDRWGVVTGSTRRAADARYAAQGHALEHSAEGAVLRAMSAYWRYLSASRELEVRVAARARAELLMEETRALVVRDERPLADLNHVEGNLATKEMAVLAAAQTLEAARGDLGVAMGLPAAETRRLGPPATDFLELVEMEEIDDPSDLTASALDNRSDLAAARERIRAELALFDAARSQTRPQLDLSLSVGYTGRQMGDGFGLFLDPLYTQVPGMNVSFGLRYALPIHSRQAKGLFAAQNAIYEQTQVVERDLARAIEVDVHIAEQAVRRAAMTVGAAAQAVRLHQATVESEKVKHQLGDATLFDVILAEDALTNAQLGEVRARTEYATAGAVLRFHTGTLVEHRDGGLSVSGGNPRSGPSLGHGEGKP